MIGTATSQNKTWFGHHLARTQHSPHTHTQIHTHISPTFTCTLPTIYQVIRNRHDCNTLQYTVMYLTSPPTRGPPTSYLQHYYKETVPKQPVSHNPFQSSPVSNQCRFVVGARCVITVVPGRRIHPSPQIYIRYTLRHKQHPHSPHEPIYLLGGMPQLGCTSILTRACEPEPRLGRSSHQPGFCN